MHMHTYNKNLTNLEKQLEWFFGAPTEPQFGLSSVQVKNSYPRGVSDSILFSATFTVEGLFVHLA